MGLHPSQFLRVLFKTFLSNSSSRDSLVLSFRSFIIFSFHIEICSPPGIDFCAYQEVEIRIQIFPRRWPIDLTSFIEKVTVFLLLSSGTFVINQVSLCMWICF